MVDNNLANEIFQLGYPKTVSYLFPISVHFPLKRYTLLEMEFKTDITGKTTYIDIFTKFGF